MQKRKIHNEKGLSLLEVLVAMIILSVSLLLLLNMAMVALDGNDWANNATMATQLMQEKLEQLRNTGDLVNGSDTIEDYVRTWSVSTVAKHLRKVDVCINWEDLRNYEKADTMTAFIQSDSV
ncbi:MAG: prepilin-type N-terminal cleavage/methylation domain-containing protein [candidate division Zixibacteria bacterium]|nr:prepilin-type N-terminal cleavage/methylation domain-containing protein [candidate division Zixibacteria bacterium]MDH3936170.1 prepilin-type N-terminal cleavage/methylation domain-containing protein [candidate division Zixibacteria bacterium]MDH4033375.1 prepilin-type N-terminal cleavage/methylation domain-containing protein [candidate division Zixibacteria bacterium]